MRCHDGVRPGRNRLCPDHRRAADAETPLVTASDDSLTGYGCLVSDPKAFPIEIVRWPAQGWRPVDGNSGDQGGITEGIFEFWWKGDTLYARNNAVGDSYLFAWSNWPEEAANIGPAKPRRRALIWRANYHPDGGQLFYPLHGESFVVPLALPGDDVAPKSSQRSGATAVADYTSIRTFGTVRSCRSTIMLNCSTARAAFTPASRSISPKNSAATFRRRCARR